MGLGVSEANLNLWKLNYEYGELNANGTVDANKNTGNLAKQTISFDGASQPFVQTYKYDALYRLTEAEEKTSSSQNCKQTYGYDKYGNRTAFSQIVGSTNLPINSETLPSIDVNTNRFNANQGYTYDKTGNVIGDAENRTFVFNGDNKQVEVKDASNNVIGTYLYDGDGKRIKKVTTNETTVFVYSGGKLAAEYSTNLAPNASTKYVATDTLGSIRAISDQNGQIVSRRDFMPFGEEMYAGTPNRDASQKYSTDGDNVRQKFTGYERDKETGLDFAEARYYKNNHGRFTAVDPLLASGKSANPQTFNRYAYVINNPLTFTDPSGLQIGCDPRSAKGCSVDVSGEVQLGWQSRTYNYGGDSFRTFEQTPIFDTEIPWSPKWEAFENYLNSPVRGLENGFISFIDGIVNELPRRDVTGQFYPLPGPNPFNSGTTMSEAFGLPIFGGPVPENRTWTQTFASGGTQAAFTGATAFLGLRGGMRLQPRSLGNFGNVADGPRLAKQLAGAEASSIFTKTGGLRNSIIKQSSLDIPGAQLNNPGVIKGLTRGGSNINDWGKYSTPSFKSPAGKFQVHFYFNSKTGKVNYNFDFKSVFNKQIPTAYPPIK